MVLNSEEVSSFHETIKWDDYHLVATDRNSKNGIYINGKKQQQVILGTGDLI